MVKILHLSDLHLGKTLDKQPRTDEFKAVLNFIVAKCAEKHIDVVLISGDVFDTALASNEAQALYYDFLAHLYKAGVPHAVIIAGNHDSPSFLQSPHHILGALNVAVISEADLSDPGKEVLVLENDKREPILIVAATPFIRQRDVHLSVADTDELTRQDLYVKAVEEHLRQVAARAFDLQKELEELHGVKIPAVAMAHLFVQGGTVKEDDGVRDLIVGNLNLISAEAFDKRYAYVALGHLHQAQTVAGSEYIRYCGTPLQMGGAESPDKSAVIVTLEEEQRSLEFLPLPRICTLKILRGTLTQLSEELKALAAQDERYAVSLEVSSVEDRKSVESAVEAVTAGTKITVTSVKDVSRPVGSLTQAQAGSYTLESLSLDQVFERLLDKAQEGDPNLDRAELKATYQRLMTDFYEARSQGA